MIKTGDLFDLSHTEAGGYLSDYDYPWQALKGIKDFILFHGNRLNSVEYKEIKPCVWVHKSATVAPTAYLGAPCIIGAETEIRHCALIRGSVVAGKGCVIGNSTELKNAILFDEVQVPHYNYVGDSILGYKSHMGAGSITSNVKSDRTFVSINTETEKIGTGLKKFGAMLGDFVEIGCNTVLNPGTVIGRNTNVYPLSCVRGAVAGNSIYKTGGIIVPKQNR